MRDFFTILTACALFVLCFVSSAHARTGPDRMLRPTYVPQHVACCVRPVRPALPRLPAEPGRMRRP
jgi:hypothetical protein